MFNPGQKVICIDDDFTPSIRVDSEMGIFNMYPKKDVEYVVRDYDKNNTGLYLEEIKNFPALYSTGFGERSFRQDRFIAAEDIDMTNEEFLELTEGLKLAA